MKPFSLKKLPIEKAEFPKSSTVQEVEYDPFLKVLTVTFRSGYVYDYLGVEKIVFIELKNAPSAGKYINQKIRPNYEVMRRK